MAISTLSDASSVDCLAWGPGQGILGTGLADGTSVLEESIMHRKLHHDGTAAIQLASDMLRIERKDGAQFLLRTTISIRGLAVSDEHLLVWNGQKAQVYELGARDATMIQ